VKKKEVKITKNPSKRSERGGKEYSWTIDEGPEKKFHFEEE